VKKSDNHDKITILSIASSLLHFTSVKMMGDAVICHAEDVLSQEARLNLHFNFSFRDPQEFGIADRLSPLTQHFSTHREAKKF
jgi:hypothetical protein